MTEPEQVQLIANAVKELADRLSLEGRFVESANAMGALQVIRVLWTRLHAPAPEPAPAEAPANGESPRPRLEAVD